MATFAQKMEEVGRKMVTSSETAAKEEAAAKERAAAKGAEAHARCGRAKTAAEDLEVLTVLAQGLAMCDDVSTREQLHHEMQLAMENLLPGAHLAAAAPKGEL